jgi:hypothetical protein
MNEKRPQDRPRLWVLNLVALPLTLALAGCGGSGTAAPESSGGKSAGPTPTSVEAALVHRVASAYAGMGAPLQAAALPAWMTVGAGGKSVALIITTSGVSFNGASDGKMTITVPESWSISVSDVNATSVAHSLVITAQGSTPLPAKGFTPAIADASTASPSVGQARGTQRFSFTALPAGNYLMVSDVSGQAAAGLWAHFDISATATVPAVTMG